MIKNKKEIQTKNVNFETKINNEIEENKKEIEIQGLLSNEIIALKKLNDIITFKGKDSQMIKNELESLLVEDEKETIFKLEKIEDNVKKTIEDLINMENKLKTFEGHINEYTEEFNKLSRSSSRVQKQNEIIQTRTSNQQKLTETLKIIFNGIELSKEEKLILSNPAFDEENIKNIEKILEKIGKFFKYSKDKYQNLKSFQTQLDEISSYLKNFISKFIENIKLSTRKVILKVSEDEINETKIPDSSEIRRLMMLQRKILFNIYLAKLEDQTFYKLISQEISDQLSIFFITLLSRYEKIWKSELSHYNLFKIHFSFEHSENEDANSFKNLDKSNQSELNLGQWLEEIFLNINNQIESDELYWCKYWSYENMKLKPEDETIYKFIENSYKSFLNKLEEFFNFYCKIAPFFIFLTDYELRKMIQNNKELEKKNKFSSIFLNKTLIIINKIKDGFINTYCNWFESLDVNTKNSGVLTPSKVFVNFNLNLFQILFLDNSDNLNSEILKMFNVTLEWIRKMSKKKEKYENIVMINNFFYITKNLERINNSIAKNICHKCKQLFEYHGIEYAKYLFNKQSTKFNNYWSIAKKSSTNDINSDSKYNKSNFMKMIKSNFGNVNKILEKTTKRIKKQLYNDTPLIIAVFQLYSEYFLTEYREIEKFCEINYNEKPLIRKSDIENDLNEKKKML